MPFPMERTNRTWSPAPQADGGGHVWGAARFPPRDRPGADAVVKLALAATLAVGTAAGCGAREACSNMTTDGLIVTVTDGAGGPAVCDATVTARDGAYLETLAPTVPAAGCTYQGAFERAGTYTIDATSAGRAAEVAGVIVTTSQCTTVPREVTIPLPP